MMAPHENDESRRRIRMAAVAAPGSQSVETAHEQWMSR